MVQHEMQDFLWLIKRNMGMPSVTLSESIQRDSWNKSGTLWTSLTDLPRGLLHFQFVDGIFVGKTIGKPHVAMSIGPWPLEFHVEQWLFCNLGTGSRILTRHVKLVAPAWLVATWGSPTTQDFNPPGECLRVMGWCHVPHEVIPDFPYHKIC